ncbi:MAG: metallopeptidase family protein [Mycobacterium sp.]
MACTAFGQAWRAASWASCTREVRHVVLHEIAHHFGISDARLIDLDRY